MANEVTFLDKGGRFVVPARFRKEMGWEQGDKLTLEVIENELRVVSVKQAIRNAQKMVARQVPAGVSLVDELLRDRKNETRRDEALEVDASQPVAEMRPVRDLEVAHG
jgi:bifunctional DNA-binding transcriptional regulator/antitoxin component of YhaV-PrlF toxin-antitoxin module